MSGSVTLQLLDGERLADALDGLGKTVARRLGRQALKEGGQPMLAAIRGRVHSVTGVLASGLKMRPGRGDRPGRISMLIVSETTRQRFAAAHPSRRVSPGGARDRYRVYYGPMVEFGHRVAGGSGERVPAHPFLRPGFDSTVEAAGGIIEKTVGDEVARQF